MESSWKSQTGSSPSDQKSQNLPTLNYSLWLTIVRTNNPPNHIVTTEFTLSRCPQSTLDLVLKLSTVISKQKKLPAQMTTCSNHVIISNQPGIQPRYRKDNRSRNRQSIGALQFLALPPPLNLFVNYIRNSVSSYLITFQLALVITHKNCSEPLCHNRRSEYYTLFNLSSNIQLWNFLNRVTYLSYVAKNDK